KALINFLPRVLADVVDENPSRPGLNVESKRIAQTKGPDGPIDSDGGVEEGIVRWNGAGRFDAQDLAQQIGQRLRVGRIGVLAHRDVELPVQAEMERSTVVILGA